MSADTIVVQAREIRDYVYRATRLTGADHGIAELVARIAMSDPDVDACLDGLLDELERGRTPDVDLTAFAALPPPPPLGSEVTSERWRRLTVCAQGYLVSEALIDSVS